MIFFAILAHEQEEVLAAQIDNVRRYNPNSRVVIYNGGNDPDFAKNLGVPVCPYSRPMVYGNLPGYLLDVMRWMEETGEEYEFLVNLDSDVLFIKSGFESFVCESMQGYDGMGYHFQIQNTPYDFPEYIPGYWMWREWDRWKPFFKTDYFARYFNPGQVYRREMVRRIVTNVDFPVLEQLLSTTEVFAIEEMLFATLAMIYGGKCRDYLWSFEKDFDFVRFRPFVAADEIRLAKVQSEFFWAHPVKGELLVEMNEWLRRTDEESLK
ncbi:MAG: hypothetical protein ACQEXQ_25195 [Bacillota bacterium]